MVRFRSAMNVVLLGMFLTILVIPALAQVFTASIHGTVLDPTGAATPGVSISLINVATAVERHTTTNATGNYNLQDVVPGDYTLSASASGFKTEKLAQFTLTVAQTATLDFSLEVGKVQSSVTVQARGEMIQASTSELGAAVTERNVEELPMNGRNFTQLLWMTPGAGPVSTAQGSGGGYEGPVGTFVQPSFNGQINRSDLYLTDGMLNNESFFSTYTVPPILESIEELKVQSHNDLAEFGQVMGGTINVVTKSGTNNLHGTVWEYIRNNDFDARSPFVTTVTPYKQNMFGAQMTGPLVLPKIYHGKNRTFFSLGYEGYRYRSPLESLYRVPTAAELAGNESDQNPIYNPYTTIPDPNKAGSFIRTQFTNNIIPTAMMDQHQLAYIAATLPAPVPTGVAGENAIDAAPLIWGQDSYNARIDENINSSNSIWFRFSGVLWNKNETSGRQENAENISDNGKNVGVSYVHTFGPSGILQAQFGYVRMTSPTVENFTTIPANWFEQNGYSVNMYGDFIGNPRVDPTLNVTGWWSGGGLNQYNKPSNDEQYKVNYSRTHGSHIFKMGVDLASTNNELLIETSSATFATPETANPESTGTTGSALASFLLGLPDSAGHRNTLESMRWGGVLGMFFEDQWKVTRNLSVNYGLRYDHNYIEPMGRIQDNNEYTGMDDFYNGTYILQKAPGSCATLMTAPCLPSGTLPANVVLLPSGRRTELQDPEHNFGPRLGFAYRLGPKTAIRAGAGIVWDNWSGVQQMSRNFAGEWPLLGFAQLSNVNPINSTPLATVENVLPSAVIPPASPFTVGFYSSDPNYVNAYSMQWNFNVQHQISESTLLSVSYVGSGSRHLDVGGYYNVAPTPGPGTPSARYPYPYMTPGEFSRSIGSSYYDSMQVLFERRTSHGGSYRINYTWSKTIDWASDGFFAAEGYSVQNPYNLKDDKGVAGFDLTNVLVANWVYALPFGKGQSYQVGNKLVDYLVGGWEFNGIGVFRTGPPFTLTVTGDLANTGNTNYERPDQVADWHVANRRPSEWFNPTAFMAPPPYTFGTMGRTNMRADWTRTFDMSIIRRFPIRERATVEFRAEAFNIFNTPIFGTPTVNLNTSTFGQVSTLASGNTPRQLQLALKVLF